MSGGGGEEGVEFGGEKEQSRQAPILGVSQSITVLCQVATNRYGVSAPTEDLA